MITIVLPHNTHTISITPPATDVPVCAAELVLTDFCAPAPQGCWEHTQSACGVCEYSFVLHNTQAVSVAYPLDSADILSNLDGDMEFHLDSKLDVVSDKMRGILTIHYADGLTTNIPLVVERRRTSLHIRKYSTTQGGCTQC